MPRPNYDPPADADRTVALNAEQTLWRRGGTLTIKCPRGTGVQLYLTEAEAVELEEKIAPPTR